MKQTALVKKMKFCGLPGLAAFAEDQKVLLPLTA
jgi:hypothetical protein